MSHRTAQLLSDAVRVCGTARPDGLYELTLSQRQLAATLGVSVRTLQYHLRKDLGYVVGTDPCIVVNPVALASVPAPVLRVVPGTAPTPTSSSPSNVELAATLVSLTERLLGLVERLLGETPAPVAVPRLRAVDDRSREEPPAPREDPSPRRAVLARPVSPSEHSLPDGLTQLTDLPTPAVVARVRSAPREELAHVVAPLAELARRCNLPGVDDAGLERLARFDTDHLRNAVRHVTESIRGGATVRRPFGLLISELERGRHRNPPDTPLSPGATPAGPGTTPEAPRSEPVAEDPVPLADWTDEAVDHLFTVAVRDRLSPSMQRAPAPLRRLLVAEYLAGCDESHAVPVR
jgi:hypothetical protein